MDSMHCICSQISSSKNLAFSPLDYSLVISINNHQDNAVHTFVSQQQRLIPATSYLLALTTSYSCVDVRTFFRNPANFGSSHQKTIFRSQHSASFRRRQKKSSRRHTSPPLLQLQPYNQSPLRTKNTPINNGKTSSRPRNVPQTTRRGDRPPVRKM
mmetsp:Transcript_1418/g.2065  ORF Transcript_1418/g.2065 Transcript_1418/m.2065 type:complete len:156 (-) Transcript_1418:325-792(-)